MYIVPLKYSAHILVYGALKRGILIRKDCEKCGKSAQAHHDDYFKPLDVRWLCRSHHMQHHSDMKKKTKSSLLTTASRR